MQSDIFLTLKPRFELLYFLLSKRSPVSDPQETVANTRIDYEEKELSQRNAKWYILKAGIPVGIDIFFVKQKESGSRPSRDRSLDRKDLFILINILFN